MTQRRLRSRKVLWFPTRKGNHDRITPTSDLPKISQPQISRSHLTGWLVIGGIFFTSSQSAIAQLRPIADETLGKEQTIVTPYTPDPRIDLIEGGAQRGANLFHSFREFNIDNGRSVYFTNPAGVTNILTRVTGGNPSKILGVLGVLGNANLFLINPRGILFGPGAQLAGGGSFILSTANSFKFPDGSEFSATNPQASTLLTVNVPVGLQYGNNPGAIRSQGAGLRVTDGQTLTLAGGDIEVDGQGSRASGLQASGGRVELGGVSAAGTVGLNRDGSLSFPNNVAKADISIINAARVDVEAGGGGSITINARNLAVTQGGQLLAGISAGLGTPEAQAGDITINATDSVKFDGSGILGPSVAASQVNRRARGNAGGVLITAGSLEVTNGALLSTSTFGIGNAGSVTITAANSVKFDGRGAFSQVEPGAIGNAGGVSIATGSLEVTNGAQISASTAGVGNAGSVVIKATNLIKFDGEGETRKESGALSIVADGGSGRAGGVSITTGSLEVTNGAFLDAGTFFFGAGDAGSVTINATGEVKFSGVSQDGESSGAFSAVLGRIGNAGGVLINAKSLAVTNGAYLSSSTFGLGNAGGVTINATDFVKFDSGGAISQVNPGAEGSAGSVSITTRFLDVTNDGVLSTSTRGKGNAGSVTINATDAVRFDGGGAFPFRSLGPSRATSQVNPGAEGNAGGISITTNSLAVTNGAFLSTSTGGAGNAGNVTISAVGAVRFDGVGAFGFSQASSSTFGDGGAGRIEITANTFEASNGGQLLSSTASPFSAGNIILKVTDSITLTGSGTGIFANTTEGSTGNGGNIIIDPHRVLIQDGATIAVNSQGSGAGGIIFLQADRLELRDKGSITAETASAQGGNIALNIKDLLLLRDNSLISATAGTAQAGGDGGNISITAPFVIGVLLENSDIRANAFTGRGGNVTITTNGIYGLQFQELETSFSDITASSRFGVSGTVILNTLNVDPSRGLTSLPIDLVDPSSQIANTCSPNSTVARGESRFAVTGRGGLPSSPDDTQTRYPELDNLGPEVISSQVFTNPNSVSSENPATEIVEAQGWMTDSTGNLFLVARSPQVTPHNSVLPRVDCRP